MTGSRAWSVAVLGTAAATSAIVALAPLTRSSSCEASSGAPSVCTSTTSSLLDSEGAGVLFVLAVPVIVAALPVAFGPRRLALPAAVLLSAAMVLGLASVGLFLIPTVVLAWIAATRAR